MLELEQLLNGTCEEEEIKEFFQDGEFYEEHYLIEAIEKHLLTEEEREKLFKEKISIEKILNGRVEGNSQLPQELFNNWNKKLGFKKFGY